MFGIAKGIKKVFKKIKENKILSTIVVAGAVWWAVGTANAFFAAPEAGLGSAMSTSASNIWSTTTEFFGAEASVAGGTEGGSAVANLGPSVSHQALDTSLVGGGGAQTGLDLTLAGNAGTTLAPAAVAPAETGMFAWLKSNPMATMMLGQAGVGAYGGYLEDKQAKREIEERANRGLMGFDASGKYKGTPATTDEVLAGPEAAGTDAARPQVVTAPIVAGQQIAPPSIPGQQVPIPREDLAKLIQQGQLARRG